MFKNFNLTSAGDRIPSFQFLVSSHVSSAIVSPQQYWKFNTAPGGVWGDFEKPSYDDSAWPEIQAPLTNSSSLAESAHTGDSRFSSYPTTFKPAISGTDYWLRKKIYISSNVDLDVLDSGTISFCTGADASLTVFVNGTLASSDWDGTGYIKKIDVQKSYFQHGENLIAIKTTVTDSSSAYYTDIAIDFDDAPTSNLASIVKRVCKRGGLTDSDIDVSALTDTVAGFPIARQANAADCLAPLLQAYFAYGTEYDG